MARSSAASMCITPSLRLQVACSPLRPGLRTPSLSLAGNRLSGPNSSADHPAVVGRVIVEVQDTAHPGDEVRVGGGLPRGGAPPGDSARVLSDQVENAVMPQSKGDVRAIRQIRSRIRSPIVFGRPRSILGPASRTPVR